MSDDTAGGIWAWARIMLVAVTLVFWVAVSWFFYLLLLPEPPPETVITEEERLWVKQRHQYHGIWWSEIGKDGVHYFERNGRKIKL